MTDAMYGMRSRASVRHKAMASCCSSVGRRVPGAVVAVMSGTCAAGRLLSAPPACPDDEPGSSYSQVSKSHPILSRVAQPVAGTGSSGRAISPCRDHPTALTTKVGAPCRRCCTSHRVSWLDRQCRQPPGCESQVGWCRRRASRRCADDLRSVPNMLRATRIRSRSANHFVSLKCSAGDASRSRTTILGRGR